MSIKPRWSKEANEDAERLINSNAYVLDMQGECMRKMEKDFLITQYCLTKEPYFKSGGSNNMEDINAKTPKYKLA